MKSIDLTTVSRWLAAVGLVGLGVYQLTQGDIPAALAAFGAAAADVGLKLVVGTPPAK